MYVCMYVCMYTYVYMSVQEVRDRRADSATLPWLQDDDFVLSHTEEDSDDGIDGEYVCMYICIYMYVSIYMNICSLIYLYLYICTHACIRCKGLFRYLAIQ